MRDPELLWALLCMAGGSIGLYYISGHGPSEAQDAQRPRLTGHVAVAPGFAGGLGLNLKAAAVCILPGNSYL